MKRKALTYLAYSLLTFIALVGLIALEFNLTEPWIRITNALWILGVIALVVFMTKSYYCLYRYIKDKA